MCENYFCSVFFHLSFVCRTRNWANSIITTFFYYVFCLFLSNDEVRVGCSVESTPEFASAVSEMNVLCDKMKEEALRAAAALSVMSC